jgi:puromycin-sensitive aminopeptidase
MTNTTFRHLLDQVKPSRYQLDLQVDLAAFTFEVQQIIDFELAKPSSVLTFHAAGLKVTNITLQAGDKQLEPTGTDLDAAAQLISFTFAEEIPAGQAQLALAVTSPLSENLHGFYRSRYELEGQTHWLATTQFEAISAREAFVCIDEPAAKAVFETTITAASAYQILSNTEAVDTRTSGALKTVKFAPTPKMSTYLVAFVVGDLKVVESQTADQVAVRVYTTPGKQQWAEFALEVATQTLDFYCDYFGTPYPLSKLDMVAIPDFDAGAMENWGLVTYRESAVLIDPEHSTLQNRQWVAQVVVHELGHQWFGNLVTMEWWTDLWLNEGFARWTESLATNHIFPEWQMWTQFVTSAHASARELDSLANTHPIEVPIHNPAEIDEIFDAISYDKGASIIRMLEAYLGAETFQKGIQHYLHQHAYGNTVTNDLWLALEQISGKPVAQLMNAWTSQGGYPIVTITPDGDSLKLSQQRFFADPAVSTDTTTLWPIPFSVLSAEGVSEPHLLKQATEKLPLKIADSAWFKPNPGQSGFYLTNYNQQQLANLIPILAELSPEDRYGVVTDIMFLVQSGRQPTTSALDVIMNLGQETNYSVWQALLGGLGEILGIISEDTLLEQLEAAIARLIAPSIRRLGWDGQPDEDYFDSLLRPQILGLAARCGVPEVRAEAAQRFAKLVQGDHIAADLRPAIYTAVARSGATETFDELWKLHQATDLQSDQANLSRAMSLFPQPELHQRFLELSLSDEVRSQDSVTWLIRSLQNRHSRAAAWKFIQANWPLLNKRYGQGGHSLTYIPRGLGMSMNTLAEAKSVEAFFATRSVPTIARSIQQALEQIRMAAGWYERDRQAIEDWLAN